MLFCQSRFTSAHFPSPNCCNKIGGTHLHKADAFVNCSPSVELKLMAQTCSSMKMSHARIHVMVCSQCSDTRTCVCTYTPVRPHKHVCVRDQYQTSLVGKVLWKTVMQLQTAKGAFKKFKSLSLIFMPEIKTVSHIHMT